jgi:hypothetical protein
MKDLIKVYLQNIITEDIDIKYPNYFEKSEGVDPKIYEKKWSSESLKEEIEKCKQALEALGFKEVVSGRWNEITMARPEDIKIVYAGFDGKRHAFNEAKRYIRIKEVYKHNGAEANCSVELDVTAYPGSAPRYSVYSNGPIITPGCAGNSERVKKFRPGISDKLREKYINAAVQVLDSKELNDIEQYAVDPNTNWDEFWKEIAAKNAK